MGRPLKVERFELHVPQRQGIWIPNVPNDHKMSFLGESKCFTILIRKIKTSSTREYACGDTWLNPRGAQRCTSTHMLCQGAADILHSTVQCKWLEKPGTAQCRRAPAQPLASHLRSALKLTCWTLQGELISLLLQLCYCALNCWVPEDGFWSAKALQLCRFLSWWMLASWGTVAGFMFLKAYEAWDAREDQDGNHRHWGFMR